MNKVAYTFSTY